MRKSQLFGALILISLAMTYGSAQAQPAWTGDLVNSIGINTHASQGYSVPNYITMLQYLGIKSARDGATSVGTPTPFLTINQATGVKFDMYGRLMPQMLTMARALAPAGALLAIEGPNEPNNFAVTYKGSLCGKGATTWLPCALYMRDLYHTVKTDPVLKSYPIFNISEVGAEIDNVGLQ